MILIALSTYRYTTQSDKRLVNGPTAMRTGKSLVSMDSGRVSTAVMRSRVIPNC